MTLFLSLDALQQRKHALADPMAIAGLAGSLQRELHAALDVPVPDGKSRLTRSAGRCVQCTVLLLFNPRNPYAHTCPTCGTICTDQVHHEWWLMNGHLWTAEQATRAAALAFLLDDAVAAARADDILATYATRYLTWPNRDNALGPTRPFFSTYLESIWLLHLATALDLRIVAAGGVSAAYGAVLDRVIAPSSSLIAGFDEGHSNRQVWHAAALLAASGLLGDSTMRDKAATSLIALLRDGLHTDGSWYEGENYHLFAHRGLLSGVTLAERAGIVLPAELVDRFERGFAAPFRTMLPDGTFPARRDSQYGVALRQYRTADWAECGIARRDTPELRAALASLYATWPELGETHRGASSADAERNMPDVRLTRADCSWRALLLARLELPPLADATPHSELLEGQGLAVFRRDGGKFWVGLDYGDPGAGHGHPDRLNLVIATQNARWLDDVGTGSYTSPTLMWYRSSMAHNAPMANGLDQGSAAGRLLAHDERGDAGWVSAEFIDPVSGVRFVRTVVVLSDHVLDEVAWTSDVAVHVDIPMQARLVDGAGDSWISFTPKTTQDGLLGNPRGTPVVASQVTRLELRALPSPVRMSGGADAIDFVCDCSTDSSGILWCADTIGPPAGAPHGLVALRQHGVRGRSLRVFSAIGAVHTVALLPHGVRVESADGTVTTHQRSSLGWSVERLSGAARNVVTLTGIRAQPIEKRTEAQPVGGPHVERCPVGATLTWQLGDADYRPTEESWREIGEPAAQVTVAYTDGALVVEAQVWLGRTPSFAPRCELNPLDNELPDVNSDGVQLHWRSATTGAWNSVIAVPDGSAVRLTVESGALDGLTARSVASIDGFALQFCIPWPVLSAHLDFDVIVNERPPTRERRRGQLVLSGAHGESAYLRGARQLPDRALHVVFDPVAP